MDTIEHTDGFVIKSVDQRQKTIYKVSESIAQQQKEFLDKGLEYLSPLVLRDVAIDIGMHESTVSRVVTNKYIHTPQGVFEMKYFFHSGIASTYGESVSSVTIKQRIKKIVEEENNMVCGVLAKRYVMRKRLSANTCVQPTRTSRAAHA